MTTQAALLFISGPLAGKGKKLKNEKTVIGRSSTCDICIADASISREHAQIVLENGVYTIKDMGSHNGIKINSEKMDQLVLTNGLRFRLGAAEIEFWDGTGVSPNMNLNLPPTTPLEVMAMDSVGQDKAPSSRIDELKHKRITNIVILFSIISMTLILGISIYVLMNKKERAVHTRFIKLFTDEERVIDLNFIPYGENEKLLKPFVVFDYTGFTPNFQNIFLDKDIFIIKESDIKNPEMGSVVLIKTKAKTGSGEITFYTGKPGEEKKTIGVLNIEVIRRPVPEVISKYLNSDLENKKVIADDMYQQITKYEDDINKSKDVWNLLINGKLLFENGEAKPEIYSKIEKKLDDLNKSIDRDNKKWFKQYDLDLGIKDYKACLRSLEKIAQINPDEENLYRQKAILVYRRIRPLIK